MPVQESYSVLPASGWYARFNRPSTNLVGSTQPYPDDIRRPLQVAEATDDPEFFTLRQQSSDSSTFTIPKAPDRPANKTHWLRPGEAITVAGVVLPDGLIYAGNKNVRFGLKEPSYIDVSLRVSDSPGDSELWYPSYNPTYGELAPRARLKAGRGSLRA